MKYKNNYLYEVIYHIKYPTILKLYSDKVNVAYEFQEVIQNEFPNVSFKKNRISSLEKVNTGNNDKKDDYYTWNFSNNSGKYIKLSPEELLLVYPGEKYNFNKLLNDIELVLTGLKKYSVKNYNHIGLRYINQIKINNEAEIDDYINPNLHLINPEFSSENFVESVTRTDLKIDEYYLIFQYGRYNIDYPEKTGCKEFILDYDCIYSDSELIEYNQTQLNEMHEIIYNRFEHDIKDKLRQEMR